MASISLPLPPNLERGHPRQSTHQPMRHQKQETQKDSPEDWADAVGGITRKNLQEEWKTEMWNVVEEEGEPRGIRRIKGDYKLRPWSHRAELRWRLKDIESMNLTILQIGTFFCILCDTKMSLTELNSPLTNKTDTSFSTAPTWWCWHLHVCLHDEIITGI